MHYTIYKVTNKINSKIYIGKHQTQDLNDGYMGSGINIRRAIKKYGIENFTKEILHVFNSESDMNAKEAELVTEEFVKENTNYNLCPGGHGGFGYINNELGNARNPFRSLDNQRKWADRRNNTKSTNTLRREKKGLFDADIQKMGTPASMLPEAIEKKKETYNKIGHQRGEKNSQYGSMWITNGDKNIKIKKSGQIPSGWRCGRSLVRRPTSIDEQTTN